LDEVAHAVDDDGDHQTAQHGVDDPAMPPNSEVPLPQAASTAISVAATPARATTLRGLLRIGCALFPIALRDTMSRTDAGDDPASWTQCDQEGESKVRASAAADVIRPYCMGTVCR
jgi:hypothetical protein